MSWSWSHNIEAHLNARANLAELDRITLTEIYSEIKAYTPPQYDNPDDESDNESEDFDLVVYDKTVIESDRLPDDVMIDFIWNFMESHRVCDNLGHDAHCCPYGCHTVSFSRKDDDA